MAKKKLDTKNIVLFVGAVLVLLFVISGGDIGKFLGSVVTTCDNFEPKSYTDFIAAVQLLNGSISQNTETLTFNMSGTVHNFIIHPTDTKLGAIDIINLEGATSCQGFTDAYQSFVRAQSHCSDDSSPNQATCLALNSTWLIANADYVTLGNKKVLKTDQLYIWCNNENQVVLRTTQLSTFSNYYAQYETCRSVVVNPPTQTQTSASQPTCNNDKVCDADETLASCPSDCKTTTTQAPRAGISNVYIIIAIVLIIGIAYYVWERGPKRGFFKKR